MNGENWELVTNWLTDFTKKSIDFQKIQLKAEIKYVIFS